jgi:hypothetical protein
LRLESYVILYLLFMCKELNILATKSGLYHASPKPITWPFRLSAFVSTFLAILRCSSEVLRLVIKLRLAIVAGIVDPVSRIIPSFNFDFEYFNSSFPGTFSRYCWG